MGLRRSRALIGEAPGEAKRKQLLLGAKHAELAVKYAAGEKTSSHFAAFGDSGKAARVEEVDREIAAMHANVASAIFAAAQAGVWIDPDLTDRSL